MSQRRAKRQRRPRYWSTSEAAVLMRHGVDEARCPNCGAEVETFISRADPGVDGIRFGCRHCCEEAAAAIDWAAQMRQVVRARHEEQARRN